MLYVSIFDIGGYVLKPLALYLPQFHEIKENNEWWGKGYTEWNAVKSAYPLYSGHYQPKHPLNDNFYDLAVVNAKTWKWQAELAKHYGIYGFCIYHYWFFTGEQLLEKPMEILLDHPEISINYCICWANETWRRTWYSSKNEILKEQRYGNSDEWENHFSYLLKFFLDPRYIKVENKPVVCIYRTNQIPVLTDMISKWNELAMRNGFSGIYIISCNYDGKYDERDGISAYYNYEPWTSIYTHHWNYRILKERCGSRLKRWYNRTGSHKPLPMFKISAKYLYNRNIGDLWVHGKKNYLGSMPAFDDTPRRPKKATIIYSKADEFHHNLAQIDMTLCEQGRNDDFVFINAWNEWGEGAYLEPDEKNKYAYLEAIRKVVK